MTPFAVFDCDGTLVDSQRRIIASVVAGWAAVGLEPPDDETIRRIVGLSLQQAFAKLAPDADAGVHARLIDGFREAFHHLATDPAYDEPLYPGARDAIEQLASAGVTLGVATGKGQRGLRKTLERHGLLDRFAVLKTADDGPSKPHPRILEDAMAEMGAMPATTVMLGDTAYDMAMARSAGAHALGVAWGYHPQEELAEHGAGQVLQDYSEAAPAVLALLGRGG